MNGHEGFDRVMVGFVRGEVKAHGHWCSYWVRDPILDPKDFSRSDLDAH